MTCKELSDIIGNNVLFAMDTYDAKREISTNRWKNAIEFIIKRM